MASDYPHLRDLLLALHDRKRDAAGKPVSKTLAAHEMGLSRATLQAWHTESDWWQAPSPALLQRYLDYYDASQEERDAAWVLRGRSEASASSGEAA